MQVRPVPLNPTLCAALQHNLKRLVPTRLTVLPAQRARLEKGNSVTKKSGAEQVECVMSGYKPALRQPEWGGHCLRVSSISGATGE